MLSEDDISRFMQHLEWLESCVTPFAILYREEPHYWYVLSGNPVMVTVWIRGADGSLHLLRRAFNVKVEISKDGLLFTRKKRPVYLDSVLPLDSQLIYDANFLAGLDVLVCMKVPSISDSAFRGMLSRV